MQKFFTGDKVRYIGEKGTWKSGKTHIIHKCVYEENGNFKYSTTKGAWFDDSDFELISRATEESFAKLDEHLKREYYG